MTLRAFETYCAMKGYLMLGKNELVVADANGATMLIVKGNYSIDTDYKAFMEQADADKKALYNYAISIASMPYEELKKDILRLYGTI